MDNEAKLIAWWEKHPIPGMNDHILIPSGAGDEYQAFGKFNRIHLASPGSGKKIETIEQFIEDKQLKRIPYDQFKDIEFVGKGGFGTVDKAIWSDGNQDKAVALKSLKNENPKKFLQEWKYHESCLSSYEIVNLLGFTNNDEVAVLEYANGGTLGDNAKKISKCSWKQKLYILYKISCGLSRIHSNKLVHRDLHDNNILLNIKDKGGEFKLGGDDDVWISDLGLCKAIEIAIKGVEPNMYGNMPFMAPELHRNNSYDAASDMYSFSMIMWELSSGYQPFHNTEENQLHIAICKGKRPKIVEGTPPCYEDLMKECWDSDPKKRPTSDQVSRRIINWIFRPLDDKVDDKVKKEIIEFIDADNNIPEDEPATQSNSTRRTTRIYYFNSSEEREICNIDIKK